MGLELLAAMLLATPAPPVQRTFDLRRGKTRVSFPFLVRAPAFRAVRLEAPVGADVQVMAWAPRRLAGVGTSTRDDDSCSRRGRVVRCETGVEGCPAPQGRWRAFIVKRTPAPARIRVSFFFWNRAG
jgi:hypothetical protein